MGDMADLFLHLEIKITHAICPGLMLFLKNIEYSNPGANKLLQAGAIAVARSLVPGSLISVDYLIENYFMKWAKSGAGAGGFGLTGLFAKEEAYQRWIKTAPERAKYYQLTSEMCGFYTHTYTRHAQRDA